MLLPIIRFAAPASLDFTVLWNAKECALQKEAGQTMDTNTMSIADGFKLNDGNLIPRIGFGTYQLEKGEQTEEAVRCAIDAGYRLIDCARFYNNEASVGAALNTCGIPREELFVTTKVWNDRQLDGTVRESVEESLRDLQLDYLDLLLIHWPVEDHYVDTWKIFEELQREGLVRSIGVSNFLTEHIQDILDACTVVPAVDQLERHPYLQDDATLSFCTQHGIIMEAWSPLGRGKCLEDPVITGIAKAHEATPAQVILAWHVQNGVIPLPRSKNPQRIAQNAAALTVHLSAADMEAISALNTMTTVSRGVSPKDFAELNALTSHF